MIRTLGNISIVERPAAGCLDVRLDDGLEEAFFCHGKSELHGGKPGTSSRLSLGAALSKGVRTEGLKWPLMNETLYPEKTRGISNELLGTYCHGQSGFRVAAYRPSPGNQ